MLKFTDTIQAFKTAGTEIYTTLIVHAALNMRGTWPFTQR